MSGGDQIQGQSRKNQYNHRSRHVSEGEKSREKLQGGLREMKTDAAVKNAHIKHLTPPSTGPHQAPRSNMIKAAAAGLRCLNTDLLALLTSFDPHFLVVLDTLCHATHKRARDNHFCRQVYLNSFAGCRDTHYCGNAQWAMQLRLRIGLQPWRCSGDVLEEAASVLTSLPPTVKGKDVEKYSAKQEKEMRWLLSSCYLVEKGEVLARICEMHAYLLAQPSA
jgi:hypothetical protein